MMTNTPDPNKPRSTWSEVIVPAAKGLETFFWRVAWFTLFATLLFRCGLH